MDFNDLEHYFKYHPVATDSRKIAHHAINEAALKFARTVFAHVQDEDCRKMAFFAIQQARMFANQGATMDELKLQKDATPTISWNDITSDSQITDVWVYEDKGDDDTTDGVVE